MTTHMSRNNSALSRPHTLLPLLRGVFSASGPQASSSRGCKAAVLVSSTRSLTVSEVQVVSPETWLRGGALSGSRSPQAGRAGKGFLKIAVGRPFPACPRRPGLCGRTMRGRLEGWGAEDDLLHPHSHSHPTPVHQHQAEPRPGARAVGTHTRLELEQAGRTRWGWGLRASAPGGY